ncbi:hypothetical protein, partial [Collinsella aerofaciens]|uniref:hypothetical protein n=1 Tax=Collinsella aerofaciens TaxID=74426 RepID=UPI0034A42260
APVPKRDIGGAVSRYSTVLKRANTQLLHEVKRDHIVIVVTHDEEMLAACDEVIPMPGCLSGRGVEGPEDRNGVGVG